MSAQGPNIGCRVCDELPPGDLADLDLLMGDVGRWPTTVWGIFDPPKGTPNALRLRFGARNVARAWLAEHGYPATLFSDDILNRHYRFDVPVVAATAEDLLNRGLIAARADEGKNRGLTIETIDPKAFLTYFDRGIKLGNRSLELLATRVEAMIARDEDVPLSTLKLLVDLGAKLATTQATLKARGLAMDGDDDGEEGFRAGSAPLPSDRIGHHRIRVVDGVSRPVTDEGQADREHFSERSKAEGGSGLPH